MKFFSMLALVFALSLSIAAGDAEAAKRLGGGKSSGLQRQGAVIRGQGLFQLPLPGQRVAQVVAPNGRLVVDEGGMCGGKIAGPISRHAVLALLVGALLATLPPAIVRRLRRRNHSQWQQHGQHRHQRAALQRRQQQQQHQRQQPEPVIAAQRAGARRLLPGGQVGAGHRRRAGRLG